MPLRVHCPSGCLIRVPANRAGKVVRCPECKKAIRLDKTTLTEVESGKPIPMKAVIVKTSQVMENDNPGLDVDLPSIDETSREDLTELPIDLPSQPKRERLAIPEQILPSSVRARRSKPQKTKAQHKKQNTEQPIQTASLGSSSPIPDFVKTPVTNLRQRASSSKTDRVALTKFFALCLCIVGVVNLVPALYFWYEWSQNVDSSALPRWIYLQAFIAAIHFIYAIYLVQIPDWSSLRAVSVAMLVVAFVFGMTSTGLLAGGGQGTFSRFLEIPHVMAYRSCLWCVAMLLLSTLMCYMGGRESANWKRTDQLLREILTGG